MIPHIIHQTWRDEKVPNSLRPYQAGWRRHHPQWQYRFWTDIDLRAFLDAHYAWFLPIYDHYSQPIMRVDAARCFILHHFGGLYADLDYECLRPFDPLLAGRDLLLGYEPSKHSERFMPRARGLDHILSNALMASIPGHPFWEHLFQALVGAHRLPHPLDATGPFLLTRAWDSYAGRDAIRVEPPQVLFPLEEGELWRAHTRGQTVPTPRPEAYGIHHWQGSWWRIPQMRWYAHQRARVVDVVEKAMARLGDLLGGEVRRKKEYVNERLFPQKVRVRRFLQTVHSPLPLSVLPEALCGAWYGVMEGGEVVARGVLDVERVLRYVAGLAEPPLITAMMMTKGRPALAQRAIRCFQNQTYPHCELLILDDDEGDALQQWVRDLGDERIRHMRLAPAGRSLGALRNLAVERARGAYVAQWDDDDLSHPQRLALEMGLILQHRAVACFLQRETLWAPGLRRLATSQRRLWEGSFLCARAVLPRYPDLSKGEDSPVADAVALEKRTMLLDYPQLYTYVFHAGNTHEAAHFERHWDLVTARHEGGAYDVAVQRLGEEMKLDLSPWIVGEAAHRYDHEGPSAPRSPAPVRGEYPEVLILTPVKDAAPHLPRYLHNLRALDYPAEKLAVAFLEGDSDDGSYELLAAELPALASKFRSARLFKEDLGYHSQLPRWVASQQRPRRAAIARSRNSLLMQALGDEAWVLWIDADVASYPADVLARLLGTGRDIVVPHCILPDGRTFDLNSFKLMPGAAHWDWSPHLVDGILQPPVGWGRRYIGDFPGGEPVELDGVGGTMLLVRAEVHRQGAIFPVVPYRYLLDTEGFAAMAQDMGFRCWGLPDLEIIHPAC